MNIWIAIIISVAPTIAAVAALIQSRKNTQKIEGIHLAINSRFDEFLKMAQEKSFAQGQKSAKDAKDAKDAK